MDFVSLFHSMKQNKVGIDCSFCGFVELCCMDIITEREQKIYVAGNNQLLHVLYGYYERCFESHRLLKGQIATYCHIILLV